jgi:hypothetical protein
MNPDDIRRWADDYRAAAARERAELRNRPLSPSDAFEAALSLLALYEKLHGSPFERIDPVSEREDAEAREAWAKLRARWPRAG